MWAKHYSKCITCRFFFSFHSSPRNHSLLLSTFFSSRNREVTCPQRKTYWVVAFTFQARLSESNASNSCVGWPPEYRALIMKMAWQPGKDTPQLNVYSLYLALSWLISFLTNNFSCTASSNLKNKNVLRDHCNYFQTQSTRVTKWVFTTANAVRHTASTNH